MTVLITEKLREHGLGYLTRDPDGLALKPKVYETEGLLVLNYCQIESPKTHPIVRECRGLILALDDFRVVSRSFDRFFNVGEADNEHFELQPGDVVMDKIDGSLIKLYYWRGKWHVSTRGTAFADATVGESGRTFADLFATAAFNAHGFDGLLKPDVTYIFELTSPESRVVVPHAATELHYLAARHNRTGEYVDGARLAFAMGALMPRRHSFDTAAQCIEAAKALPDLDEGYVVYRAGAPICKIKSPRYVAAHHLFSGPITDKRIAELLIAGEVPEFAVYFPEFADRLARSDAALREFLAMLDARYAAEWSVGVESQKHFASRVVGLPYSAVLFQARAKGVAPSKAFAGCKDSLKLDLAIAAITEHEIEVAA